MLNRERIIRFLLRRPSALAARGPPAGRSWRWPRPARRFLVWSAVIHLELWGDGYSDISVIGPLFLAQGIGFIVVAVAIVAFRSLALLAAGAVAGAATAVGLLLTVHGGLFGYTESLSVPYATLSLAVEFTAAFVLLLATAAARSEPARPRGGQARRPGAVLWLRCGEAARRRADPRAVP